MSHSFLRPLAVIPVGVLLAGCASFFMNGGKLVDADYEPKAKATYTAPGCKMSDGSTVAGPAGVKYLLVEDQGGLALFEESPDHTGAVITNKWSDDKGDHYFGWVQQSGWEYVFPKDPAAKPQRVIYVNLETGKSEGATKPTSASVGACELVPAG